ncbi:hypothetical protein ADL00_15690, partial [Streptomyces sp. AS58]|uniref:hypothetical protein n=1 Tax=Streptomyces sp. AS58 TaxID=1519489 RepID=UPI0006C1C416
PDLDHQGQSQTKITKWVTFDPPSEGQRSAVAESKTTPAERSLFMATAGGAVNHTQSRRMALQHWYQAPTALPRGSIVC